MARLKEKIAYALGDAAVFLCYKPGLYYCFFMGKEIVVENPLFNALEIDTVPL